MLQCQLLAKRECNNKLTLNHHREVSIAAIVEIGPPIAVIVCDSAGDFNPAPLRVPVLLVGPFRERSAKKEIFAESFLCLRHNIR